MFDSIISLDILRIALALGMLGIASYNDISKREITDLIWVIFGVIGVALVFFEPNMWEHLTSVGIAMIIAPFALIMWRFGLFGGADAFALIVLAVLVPNASLVGGQVTPFTTLTNAVLLSIIPMITNFVRNLIQISKKVDIFEGFNETKKRQIFAMLIGYRAKNPKHSFSIERRQGKQKKLNLSLQHAEYAPFCSTPNTWVTPGIPYMLFITGGFIIQLVYGDIIFKFLGA